VLLANKRGVFKTLFYLCNFYSSWCIFRFITDVLHCMTTLLNFRNMSFHHGWHEDKSWYVKPLSCSDN